MVRHFPRGSYNYDTKAVSLIGDHLRLKALAHPRGQVMISFDLS